MSTKIEDCPFCGEPAELDTRRGYAQYPSGERGVAVAITCSKCPCDMSLCTEDYRSEERDTLIEWLTEAWNKRAQLTSTQAKLKTAEEDVRRMDILSSHYWKQTSFNKPYMQKIVFAWECGPDFTKSLREAIDAIQPGEKV